VSDQARRLRFPLACIGCVRLVFRVLFRLVDRWPRQSPGSSQPFSDSKSGAPAGRSIDPKTRPSRCPPSPSSTTIRPVRRTTRTRTRLGAATLRRKRTRTRTRDGVRSRTRSPTTPRTIPDSEEDPAFPAGDTLDMGTRPGDRPWMPMARLAIRTRVDMGAMAAMAEVGGSQRYRGQCSMRTRMPPFKLVSTATRPHQGCPSLRYMVGIGDERREDMDMGVDRKGGRSMGKHKRWWAILYTCGNA